MPENRKRKRRRSALRFDIAVNGKRICLAGSGRYGVLSLAVNWVRRDPRVRPQSKTIEKWCREECDLRIGAVTSGYQEAWKKVPLREDDEITIRILGPGSAEIPLRRFRTPKI